MIKRSQLEHALRAAKEITGENDFVVIGSGSILGSFPIKGETLTMATKEVDIYPRYKPEKSEMLNAIGVKSSFDVTHGFYVDPVSPTTATLPKGWEDRLVKVCNENTNGAVGWCLEPHDVAVAKLIAHRPKDIEFIEGLLKSGSADVSIIRKRLADTQVEHHQIRNMAEDYLDQILDDIMKAKNKEGTLTELEKLMNRSGIHLPDDSPGNKSRDKGPEMER